MQPFDLKCYVPNGTPPPSGFFLFSRGLHSGRPAFSANPNCFVLHCSPADLDPYYWLVFPLWMTRQFESLLCGSVVPFLRIGEARACIHSHLLHEDRLQKTIDSLGQLWDLETNLKKQLSLIS